MRYHLVRILAVSGLVALGAAAGDSGAAPPDQRGQIWAGCELFATFGTPANVSPGAGQFDNLYKSPAGFRDGIGAISDAAPGHGAYNGGRWREFTLKAGVDGAKYAGACSAADLDPNDFEETGVYFQCPLVNAR